MIFDTINQLDRYKAVHPLFPAAIEFLKRVDLADLPDGKHDISGDDIFAIVARDNGKSANDALLEVHNRYIDIQVILSGVDSIGWKARENCSDAVADFDQDRDIQFYSEEPDTRVEVSAMQFAIFFPEDAHAPMVSDGFLHKIVVKIANDHQ
ncbi:MAG: YhcH/YjgK/YiaL family protein [Kiritimatiellae bacterium]|nr:YhcH/YjgK/YiaL family protein [Kiritimatiellia bacterium]